jgi:hypothetical protein
LGLPKSLCAVLLTYVDLARVHALGLSQTTENPRKNPRKRKKAKRTNIENILGQGRKTKRMAENVVLRGEKEVVKLSPSSLGQVS